jgi:hypothetical protein
MLGRPSRHHVGNAPPNAQHGHRVSDCCFRFDRFLRPTLFSILLRPSPSPIRAS